MKKTLIFIFIILMFPIQAALALSPEESGAPEALQGWEKWLLFGHEETYLCPAEQAGGKRHCAWPVSLSLDLDNDGGRFQAIFELKKEGFFPLPGGPGAWPELALTAEGERVPVLGSARPQVWLPAGRHSLMGYFIWPELPESLDLPPGFAMNIKVDGDQLDFPAMESDYSSGRVRLWLKSRGQNEGQLPEIAATGADSLKVTVNRLVLDSQPQMIKTRLKLVVGGSPRDVNLANALLPETKATLLSSPLPAQLLDGALRVRVKPGTYEIEIDSRSLKAGSTSLGPVPKEGGEAEFWAFQAQDKLRLVEVSGAEQIDPSQADIYRPWRNFPVYYMEPGTGLEFHTIQRGDPEPAPDKLILTRECWLDYSGKGLSCRDHLSGELRRQWHLSVSPPFSLAQASLADQAQVITWQTDSKGRKAPGLQLRNGRINLSADLRLDDFNGVLPASGWDHELEAKVQKLNLPPGYRLFHVSGADALSDGYDGGASTWTSAWGTLDFFIVLIIAIATWKLFGLKPGLLALAAMILGYHEVMAPRMVFLHLLACAALLRLMIKPGKARFLVQGWRFAAALTLVVLCTMFFVNQVRIALYPQLENPSLGYGSYNLIKVPLGYMFNPYSYQGGGPPYDYDRYRRDAGDERLYQEYDQEPETTQEMVNEMMFDDSERKMENAAVPASPRAKQPAQSKINKERAKDGLSGDSLSSSFTNRMVRLSQSPEAKVQNSVPRPQWSWRTTYLNYNDIVTADQEVKLFFIGPIAGRLLALIRIALMAAFALMVLRPEKAPTLPENNEDKAAPQPAKAASGAAAIVAAIVCGLTLWALPASALAQPGLPDAKILDEYRHRLLKPKEVMEAGVPLMRLSASRDRLLMTFEIESMAESIIGLPTLDKDVFRPESVSVGGLDLPLLEDQGRWLALVPEGLSELKISGRLKKSAPKAFQINFYQGLKPQRTELADIEGWQVEGLEKDGQLIGSALYLSPNGQTLGEETDRADIEEITQTLEPFFLVHRTVSLGLQWQVHTSVRRITPIGSPVSLRLPLLPGENPISAGFRRDDQKLTLNFGPQDSQLSWDSSLALTDELILAAEEGSWTESWSLDVSPIWRVKTEGLPPVQNMVGGFWQPQWRPWPGEKLSLKIDRPTPVPGQYLVVDSVKLNSTLGEQNRNNELSFQLRSSQGGPWSFNLPAGSKIREFKVNGKSMPLSAEPATSEASGPSLTASLTAGAHQIDVNWTEDKPLTLVSATPSLNLGVPTANISTSLKLPEKRWVLWAWGPVQGPAVQFWSLLAVVLLAALALKRFNTPLSTGSWFLLGLGLIQLNIFGALVVGGWLILLSFRLKKPVNNVTGFNLWQIILVIWTLVALILIYKAIKHGLLQNPDMLINGGGSYGQRLSWFSDSANGPWATGQVFTVSIWLYKALMLMWSLWLSISLIKWLIWGWGAFSAETLWKKGPPRPEKPLNEYQRRRAALQNARREAEAAKAAQKAAVGRALEEEEAASLSEKTAVEPKDKDKES